MESPLRVAEPAGRYSQTRPAKGQIEDGFGLSKGGTSSARVPMTKSMRALLDELGGRFRKAGHVFVEDGQDFTSCRERNRVSQRTKAAADAAKLAGVTFHTLRHTAGSQVQISKVLGLASTATTDRYMHLAPEHLKGAVDAIEATLATQRATQAGV